MNRKLFALALLALAPSALAQNTPPATIISGATYTVPANAPEWVTFHNDFYWTDDQGNRIQTRSGCLCNFNAKWYWYGGTRGFRDQTCYSSTDLVHWKYEGVILTSIVDANRMEVLYNAPTKKYVMLLKYDGNGAFLGVATADKPEGPFAFKTPPVTDAQMVAMSPDQLKESGPYYLVDNARMGDMSVWVDDDGKAYLAYVSWAIGTNRQHGLYLLSDDYTAPAKRLQLWDIGGREANHIFKRDGIYYYGTSRTAGIQSSGTSYYTTKDITNGPWSPAKPMPTPGSMNSWDSQVDFVYPFKGTGGGKDTVYMFEGDRWTKDLPKGRNGDYVWLPLEFNGTDPVANYYQDWDLNVKAGTWRKFDPARNLAAKKTATASSVSGNNIANNVTDVTTWENYMTTRWESAPSDPQWITVDLDEAKEINRVILKWDNVAAKQFKIQVSTDNANWTDVFSTNIGGSYTVTDETFKTTTARYVRMNATQRATAPAGGRGGRGGRGGPAPAGSPATTSAATAPAAPTPPNGGYSLFDFEVLKD